MEEMKYSLVRIEDTQYYADEFIKKMQGKCFTIYMYTPGQYTFCCELIPSYYLIPVDYYCDNEGLSEDLREEFEEANYDSDPIYIHAHYIDRIPESEKFEGYDFESDDDAEEFYRGNQML